MAVLLFFISAFLIFIAYLVYPSSTKFNGPFSSIRLAFIKAFLSISLISYLLVEVFSFNNQLSFTSISIAWGIVALGMGIFLWKNYSNIHFQTISFKTIEKKHLLRGDVADLDRALGVVDVDAVGVHEISGKLDRTAELHHVDGVACVVAGLALAKRAGDAEVRSDGRSDRAARAIPRAFRFR